jgi:hypothetical protein
LKIKIYLHVKANAFIDYGPAELYLYIRNGWLCSEPKSPITNKIERQFLGIPVIKYKTERRN